MKNWYLSKNALSETDINAMTREEILDWLYYGGNETPRQKLGEWDPREDTLEEYLAEIIPVMIEGFGGKITVKDAAKYLTSIWNTTAIEMAENENAEMKEDTVKKSEKVYARELGAAIAFGRFMARESLEVDSLEDAREVLAAMRQDAYVAAGENMPSKDELPNELSLEYAISFGEHMYLQELTAPKGITAVEIFKTMEKDYQKNRSFHYFSNFTEENIEGYFVKAQNKTTARSVSSKNVR